MALRGTGLAIDPKDLGHAKLKIARQNGEHAGAEEDLDLGRVPKHAWSMLQTPKLHRQHSCSPNDFESCQLITPNRLSVTCLRAHNETSEMEDGDSRTKQLLKSCSFAHGPCACTACMRSCERRAIQWPEFKRRTT